jgi:hypothetical protein
VCVCVRVTHLVLRAHFVFRVVVSRTREPAVLSTRAIVCRKLSSDIPFVLEHLVVACVRGEAARVVLVEDLNLKSTWLETSEQVPERVKKKRVV